MTTVTKMTERLLAAWDGDVGAPHPAGQTLISTTTGAAGALNITWLPGGLALQDVRPVESAVYLLAGSCQRCGADRTERLVAGDAVYYPPGAARDLRAPTGRGGLILEASAGDNQARPRPGEPTHQPTAPQPGAEPADEGRPARAVAGELTGPLHQTGGFAAMDVRWIVTDVTVQARGLALATSCFTDGGGHDLHRHPHADEFFLVVSGGGDQLTSDAVMQVQRGDAVYVPAGTWHGFRASAGVTTRAVYGYLGTPSLGAAGYELLSTQQEGIGAL